MTMIKTNELRIGNWIDFKGQLKQIVIPKDLEVVHSYGHEFIPIKITPKMLETFGFERDDDDSDGSIYYRLREPGVNSYYSISNDGQSNCFHIESGTGDNATVHNMNNLHEMQNLYFALTEYEMSF